MGILFWWLPGIFNVKLEETFCGAIPGAKLSGFGRKAA